MTRKVFGSAADAVADIGAGASLAVGGFGLCGIPDELIAAIAAGDATNLEVFSNNCGVDDRGLGILLTRNQIRRVTASYVGENKEFARQYLSGELEVELTPQGTLAEKLRAGGAGIPAFFTPAGVGTPVSDGGLPWRYARRRIGGRRVSAEGGPRVRGPRSTCSRSRSRPTSHSSTPASATPRATSSSSKAAGNFNPLAAMAGRICIAQVEQLVEPGVLDPAQVHLPGIFVDRIVHTGPQDKQIEKRTVAARKD